MSYNYEQKKPMRYECNNCNCVFLTYYKMPNTADCPCCKNGILKKVEKE